MGEKGKQGAVRFGQRRGGAEGVSPSGGERQNLLIPQGGEGYVIFFGGGGGKLYLLGRRKKRSTRGREGGGGIKKGVFYSFLFGEGNFSIKGGGKKA